MAKTPLSESIQTALKKHHLLSANALLELFAKGGEKYNKTSVYRALDRLLTEDKICQYAFSEKETQYELRDEHHDHVICEHCGKIEVAECQFAHPKAIAGFQLSHHHLTLFGICQNCGKNQK